MIKIFLSFNNCVTRKIPGWKPNGPPFLIKDILWSVSAYSGKFLDTLESLRTLWNVSGNLLKVLDTLESFRNPNPQGGEGVASCRPERFLVFCLGGYQRSDRGCTQPTPSPAPTQIQLQFMKLLLLLLCLMIFLSHRVQIC